VKTGERGRRRFFSDFTNFFGVDFLFCGFNLVRIRVRKLVLARPSESGLRMMEFGVWVEEEEEALLAVWEIFIRKKSSATAPPAYRPPANQHPPLGALFLFFLRLPHHILNRRSCRGPTGKMGAPARPHCCHVTRSGWKNSIDEIRRLCILWYMSIHLLRGPHHGDGDWQPAPSPSV
jgi:hypothetical protein